MNRFQGMGRRNLANRLRSQMANRTRRPRPGMSMARPRPGVMSPVKRGGTAVTGGMPSRMGFAEGGEALKTPVDQLPNEGLKKLAKSPKGRKAVARMGFADGGEAIAKGGKCPHRGKVRGTGIAVSGVGFKGVK